MGVKQNITANENIFINNRINVRENRKTQVTLDTRHNTKINKTKIQHRQIKEWATQTPLQNQEWTKVLSRCC